MQTQNNPTSEELHSALFANMVMQQGNLALMFLGKIPNPETGEAIFDLDGARMFIDQLEMLHSKTRGNLSSDESALLGQTLATVRMTYVEEARTASRTERPSQASAKLSQAAPAMEPEAPPAPSDDEKKKFVKKY